MPIQVHDYEWSQTPTAVIIKVPLKGVPGHKADIFSTNEYIKVCGIVSIIMRLGCCRASDETKKVGGPSFDAKKFPRQKIMSCLLKA